MRRHLKFWLPALCLPLAGCLSLHREPPRPGITDLHSVVSLPAQSLGNNLVIEAKWDHYGPYHFLVDTGSSVTLVTPELAQRYAAKNMPPPDTPEVRVRSSEGGTTALRATTLTRIELGAARFSYVPALIYDCVPLSAQLGVKIDGVLGFPLFRETLLTLDYPHNRVLLQPGKSSAALPGSPIAFSDTSKMPVVPVRMGDRNFTALIDSASDDPISLNPAGLSPQFAFGPVVGPTVGTLTGDRVERLARLAETLYIGSYAVPRPVVAITDGLSALGGGILKYFTVTFDQEHGQVTFYRDATDPIAVPGPRSTGLSFDKTPAYWRVVGVVPGSPASAAGVELGDIVTRIDGEAVAKWDTRRFEQRMANAEEVEFTFLDGKEETVKRLKVVELVP